MKHTFQIFRTLISILLVLCAHLLFSQNSKQESAGLIKEVRASYINLEKYLYDKELEKALNEIKILEEQVDITNKKDLLPVIDAFYIGTYLIRKDFAEAYSKSKSAVSKIQNSTNREIKAYVYLSVGAYHHAIGDFVGLSKNSLIALDYAKYTTNRKLLGDIYYKMYCVHTQWDDLETDLYAQKALQAYRKTDDYNGLSNAYSAKVYGVTNLYTETGDQAYQDSILYFLKKALNVFDGKPNTYKRTKAIAALNLANHYKNLFINAEGSSSSQLMDSVFMYLEIVDNIPPTVDYNYALRANSSNIKGGLAYYLNDKEGAEKYFLQAFDNLTKENINPSYHSLYNSAETLQNLYEEQNDYKKAYFYSNEKNEYNSIIYDQQQANEVLALEAEFENEKFKEDLEFQQTVNEEKRVQLWLSIGLLVITFIALLLSYLNSKNKFLAKKQKFEILKKEKQQAISKIKLEEEKNARLSAEQAIINIEKERISKKAMANALQAERKDELLNNLGEKIKSREITLDELYKTLKIEKRTDKEISNKIDEFAEINPQFFETLKQKSKKISDLDLKYCAYFYLGLNSKEIASNLNVEQKSVRMTKYRIKKKLDLPKEMNLDDYLKNLA